MLEAVLWFRLTAALANRKTDDALSPLHTLCGHVRQLINSSYLRYAPAVTFSLRAIFTSDLNQSERQSLIYVKLTHTLRKCFVCPQNRQGVYLVLVPYGMVHIPQRGTPPYTNEPHKLVSFHTPIHSGSPGLSHTVLSVCFSHTGKPAWCSPDKVGMVRGGREYYMGGRSWSWCACDGRPRHSCGASRRGGTAGRGVCCRNTCRSRGSGGWCCGTWDTASRQNLQTKHENVGSNPARGACEIFCRHLALSI